MKFDVNKIIDECREFGFQTSRYSEELNAKCKDIGLLGLCLGPASATFYFDCHPRTDGEKRRHSRIYIDALANGELSFCFNRKHYAPDQMIEVCSALAEWVLLAEKHGYLLPDGNAPRA